MSLDGLTSFAVFADCLNFTRAAEELHISQPALHVKVRKLASAVGVELYAREGRQLQLTPAGRAVADFAKRARAELSDFLSGLGEAEEPVVVAAGEGTHRYVLGPAVRLLASRGVRLRLLSTDRDETVAAVRAGRAHLGVTVSGPLPAGLGHLDLASYPQVAVLPSGHALGRRRSLSVRDLFGEQMIVPPPGRPQRETLEQVWRQAGSAMAVGAEAEGWPQVLYFASLGVGVGVVNGSVGPSPGTVTRPLRDLPAVTYCAVFRNADQQSPGHRRLLETLQASLP